jgi:hypothetical protein
VAIRFFQRPVVKWLVSLAALIGNRNHAAYKRLQEAVASLEGRFKAAGYPAVGRETYAVDGQSFVNLGFNGSIIEV